MNPETTPKSSKGKIIIAAIIIIILIIVGIVYSRSKATPSEAQQAAENTALIKSVSALMLVPTEQPIIATINQADVLVKEQAFYTGSQNGDKLIIFPKAQKAIIFSPSRNIIVNSGPFVINSGAAATPEAPAPAAPVAPKAPAKR